TTMAEVLTAAKAISDELQRDHGLQFPIQISAHFGHELAIEMLGLGFDRLTSLNNQRAIGINEWREGAKSGKFALLGNMVPGTFGFRWSREGGLTNPDPEIVGLHKAALLYGITLANENANAG